jgi:formylglycine-generating enzyme required for sulfatase activity
MVTSYGFGGDSRLLGFYGWYSENSGKKKHEPKRQRPNLRGLFDLHGNVYEWCHDWLGTYSSGLAVDPAGPARGSLRVYRGGGWGNVAAYCRMAFRYGYQPTSRNTPLGFRPAQVPVAGPELQSGGAGGNDPEEE